MTNKLRLLLRSFVPSHEMTPGGMLACVLTLGALTSLTAFNLGLAYYLP